VIDRVIDRRRRRSPIEEEANGEGGVKNPRRDERDERDDARFVPAAAARVFLAERTVVSITTRTKRWIRDRG
jgi:hypothetical protein